MIELPIPPRVEREANPEFVEILKAARACLWDGTGLTVIATQRTKLELPTELPTPLREVRGVNPIFADALREAMQVTSDGVDPTKLPTYRRFICHALEAYDGPLASQCVQSLQCDIMRSLGKSISYHNWVSQQVDPRLWDKLVDVPDEMVHIQAGRIRWINQLIEEYGGTP